MPVTHWSVTQTPSICLSFDFKFLLLIYESFHFISVSDSELKVSIRVFVFGGKSSLFFRVLLHFLSVSASELNFSIRVLLIATPEFRVFVFWG